MTFGAGEALELLDWKRQVFLLYEQVRASPDPRSAWALWVATRDRLYREHPQSPVSAARRAGFPGCSYFDYDPEARVLGRVEPFERAFEDVVSSVGAAFPFSRIGTARFTVGMPRPVRYVSRAPATNPRTEAAESLVSTALSIAAFTFAL